MDSPILIYIVAALLSYLLGSVPTGIIVVKLFGGVDPRSAGSRNIGATNVGRTSGKAAGILTLFGDAVKGALPVFLAFRFYPAAPFASLVGLSAFLGHIFPIYLGFRGGKGVATALGVMALISPLATLLSALVFVILVAIKRYVSLGSIAAAAMLPVFISIFPAYKPYLPMSIAVSVLVIIKHRENIKRLAHGTENKIGGKKKD